MEEVPKISYIKFIEKQKERADRVFVGRDENGVLRHAHMCSLNSAGRIFLINVEGSDPRCSFHHIGTSDRLHIFEVPIDLPRP